MTESVIRKVWWQRNIQATRRVNQLLGDQICLQLYDEADNRIWEIVAQQVAQSTEGRIFWWHNVQIWRRADSIRMFLVQHTRDQFI